MKDILVVEHDDRSREFLVSCITSKGLAVESSADLAEACEVMESGTFRIVITNLKLPDGEGVDILKKVKSANRGTDVIVITGHGTVETAIECIKQGAVDFLLKPLCKTRLDSLINRTLERQNLIAETISLRRRLERAGGARLNGEIAAEELAASLLNGGDSPGSGGSALKRLDQIEKEYIQIALHLCGGNRSKAAKLLGIDRGTLARKLRRSRLPEGAREGSNRTSRSAGLDLRSG